VGSPVLSESRPAFYALEPGGWRDYLTLLHPPYTLWHLSYVAIGAALAPHFEVERLVVALVAFFLAVGIGAHALDELKGHPLQTRISDRTLVWLSAVSIGGAVALGVYGSIAYTPWLAPLVAVGAFVVVAYNLELFGGAFHSDLWFALDWGAFPLLVGYLAMAERFSLGAVVAAAFAGFLSLAQRHLSTQVRTVRRRVVSVSGTLELADGNREPVTDVTLIKAPEAALRAMTLAVISLAVGLVLLRLT
jgi:hypothetical protein